jgi:hypothetical protein
MKKVMKTFLLNKICEYASIAFHFILGLTGKSTTAIQRTLSEATSWKQCRKRQGPIL